MIGAHDTFTFQDAGGIAAITPDSWKCQSVDYETLYKKGVRMFDIRVYWDSNWRACHGAAHLSSRWATVQDICNEMKTNCPEAIYRIVLENGKLLGNPTGSEIARFITEVQQLNEPNLWRAIIQYKSGTTDWVNGIKNNNQELFDKGYKFALLGSSTEAYATYYETPSVALRIKNKVRDTGVHGNQKLNITQKDLITKNYLCLLNYIDDVLPIDESKIKIENKLVNKLYVGTNPVTEVYLGTKKVY